MCCHHKALVFSGSLALLCLAGRVVLIILPLAQGCLNSKNCLSPIDSKKRLSPAAYQRSYAYAYLSVEYESWLIVAD